MQFFALVSAEGNDKELGPTRGPTVVSPTTLGIGPWSQVRLPDNIKPSHYNIILFIDLTKPHFNGTVSISINISNTTSYVLLHTSNMNVTLVEVKKESGGKSSSCNLHVSIINWEFKHLRGLQRDWWISNDVDYTSNVEGSLSLALW